jgi:hypothetical protein
VPSLCIIRPPLSCKNTSVRADSPGACPMNIFLVLALSLMIALLRGGRLGSLLSFRIRHLWLFFVSFFIQALVFTPLRLKLNLEGGAVGILYVASMLIGAITLWLNRQGSPDLSGISSRQEAKTQSFQGFSLPLCGCPCPQRRATGCA